MFNKNQIYRKKRKIIVDNEEKQKNEINWCAHNGLINGNGTVLDSIPTTRKGWTKGKLYGEKIKRIFENQNQSQMILLFVFYLLGFLRGYKGLEFCTFCRIFQIKVMAREVENFLKERVEKVKK